MAMLKEKAAACTFRGKRPLMFFALPSSALKA